MKIQCECGKFQADIKKFPKQTPGRVGCYCDDCQSYSLYIRRTDLLDKEGCTEIVPVYPSNFVFLSGKEHLQCVKLSSRGVLRWRASCCNTPIANTAARVPWAGVIAKNFRSEPSLEKILGPVKCRIMGKFAKGKVAPRTAEKIDLRAMITVLPFLLKGRLLKKYLNSPFYESDGKTPITKPLVLSLDEKRELKERLQNITHY